MNFRFRFPMRLRSFAYGLFMLTCCTELSSQSRTATAAADSAPDKPTKAPEDVPPMSLAEAKDVAKSAYEVLQKGTSDPRKIVQLLADMDRAKQAVGLVPHQKELLSQLEKGLDKIKSLSLNGWENASEKITNSSRPQAVRRSGLRTLEMPPRRLPRNTSRSAISLINSASPIKSFSRF